ncbi:MAG: 4Fe-4S binding protein [Eubacteriales bacterium]|nr:4Fe-4S binding protein [Eubacteriales bacterium]
MPKQHKKLSALQQLQEANKTHSVLQGPVADLHANTLTGNWRQKRPVITMDCRNCGLCEKYCPCGVISPGDEIRQIDYTWCKGCGVCISVCPFAAIKEISENQGEEK